MKITDDVQSLMRKLEKSVSGAGGPSVPQLLAEVLHLFDYVKNILPSTNAIEREAIFLSMAELHMFLQVQMKCLCDATGLSEEQLLRFSENPDNFSKDQWNLLGEVKSKMSQQSQEIKDVMKSLPGPFVRTPGAFLEQMQQFSPENVKKLGRATTSPPQKKGKKKGRIQA